MTQTRTLCDRFQWLFPAESRRATSELYLVISRLLSGCEFLLSACEFGFCPFAGSISWELGATSRFGWLEISLHVVDIRLIAFFSTTEFFIWCFEKQEIQRSPCFRKSSSISSYGSEWNVFDDIILPTPSMSRFSVQNLMKKRKKKKNRFQMTRRKITT